MPLLTGKTHCGHVGCQPVLHKNVDVSRVHVARDSEALLHTAVNCETSLSADSFEHARADRLRTWRKGTFSVVPM